jgi:acetyl-CoA carboxylase biotin carboxyl carrier protein
VTLTAKEVAEITRLLEESSFDELYLEIDGLKLSLRRGGAANGQAGPPVMETGASPAPTAGSRPAGAWTSTAGPASAAGPMLAAGPTPRAGSPATWASAPGPAPTPAVGSVHTIGSAAGPAPARDPASQDISAPLLGTFYRAPKPGAPPFVEVGSQVEEDTIIGIIEVMKLMNTVRAGVRGKITEILGRDGVLVEYGETLMRVSKAG